MRTTLLYFLVAFPSFCYGQKHDHVWLLGYESWTGHPDFGGTVIDFNSYPPDIYYQYLEANFLEENASMCDGQGELLFYSNGLHVFNKQHGLMENGDSLNPGPYADGMVGYGYHLWQGAVALADPGNPERYYLLHMPKEIATAELSWHSPVIYYSLVDMSENGGLGKVIEKNDPVVTDTLGQGQLTAVRHGNGRDWWLLDHEFVSNRYYRILVDPEGVHNLGTKSKGTALPDEGIGQSVFSPDGRFYARINTVNVELGQFLDIYEFDRCSGLLENQLRINYNDTASAAGLAISHNSRFLYVSSHRKIYQYDLHAADIPASKQTVAIYDGFKDGSYATRFYLAQLAPDGKIYICSPTSTRYLHVIHQPDKPCPECNIEQHGVSLPTYNAASIPNHPNYRLGPLDGSPCDTLGLDNLPVAKFRYEQDSMDYLTVEFTDLSYYEPAEWLWDFGDNMVSQDTSPVYTFPTDGVYEICLTVSNDNGSDTHCQTIQLGTVATGEEMPKVGVTVFPNPAREGVNVILRNGYLPKAGSITLYDALGRPQLSQKVHGGWNSLLLEGLAPGIYFYEVKDGERPLGSGKLVRGK